MRAISLGPEWSGTDAIVYDGDCPFCARYVALLRIREALDGVSLVNARDAGPLVQQLSYRGVDLDEGMALVLSGQVYHGAQCMTRLAMLSTSSAFFNRVNAILFRSPPVSRLVYPILKLGRNLTLKVLKRGKIVAAPEQAD